MRKAVPGFRLCLALVGLMAAGDAGVGQSAQGKPPPELASLQRRYAQDTESAIRPIRERHLEALQGLVRSLTVKRDLQGASSVQQELDSVKSFGGGLAPGPGADSGDEQGALRRRYTQDTESAMRPIRERYLQNLEGLVRSFTVRGDLQGALAARQEIDFVKAGGSELKTLFGTWKFGGPQSPHLRTFHLDGTMTTPNFGGASGSWKRVARGVEVTYPNGNKDVMLFPIDPAGTKVHATFGDTLIAVRVSRDAP